MLTAKNTVNPILRVTAISKRYGNSKNAAFALNDISLEFSPGSFNAIMGPSGSGKSTMLQCASGLEQPTSGEVWLGDIQLNKLKEPRMTLMRRERIGFIFQAFNLIDSLSARDNILLPLKLSGRRPDEAWFRRLVEETGLESRLNHRPSEMSGGQQQRVAVARALITKPDIVFADEPTGALDTHTGMDILEMLRETVVDLKQTLVMVTHDPNAASFADRVIFMADGQVTGEIEAPTTAKIMERMNRLEGR
ncbi:ABC transporter ATP-binding protein [Paenibacillus sp. GSMTC-2017]|uniref:ABC transporter ATP-binding protein n=1 Tax=Paenibacillus sp. GSMTC-2017 TaxID=2794350 RepID=UPI0018D5FA76|nr:ABC transporter ATP-binding protein [Paenibacillus sp. GSMTC-2017]MBH5318459.1 ABC transporter ATP-binding protein [Paenibacillus sp. GSMTC-2017]